MGKGSKPRPRSITREEEDLRHEYAAEEISLATFNRRFTKLKRAGLIRRSGRILK
jgi:hypothetical protein